MDHTDLTIFPVEIREIIFDRYMNTLKARAQIIIDIIDHSGLFHELTIRSDSRRGFLDRRRRLIHLVTQLHDVSSLVKISAYAKSFANYLEKIDTYMSNNHQTPALKLDIYLLSKFVINIQNSSLDEFPNKKELCALTCKQVQDLAQRLYNGKGKETTATTQ